LRWATHLSKRPESENTLLRGQADGVGVLEHWVGLLLVLTSSTKHPPPWASDGVPGNGCTPCCVALLAHHAAHGLDSVGKGTLEARGTSSTTEGGIHGTLVQQHCDILKML